jgi:hypothetical protein
MKHHAQVELAHPFRGREKRVEIEPVSIARILADVGNCRSKAAKSKPVLLKIEDES